MSLAWYEVWADETHPIPYLLLVVPDERNPEGVRILDPREGLTVSYEASNYDDAKLWLLEDEFTRVTGRMDPNDYEPSDKTVSRCDGKRARRRV